jgi:hypothetical protein
MPLQASPNLAEDRQVSIHQFQEDQASNSSQKLHLSQLSFDLLDFRDFTILSSKTKAFSLAKQREEKFITEHRP